jgi:hypothetical protein
MSIRLPGIYLAACIRIRKPGIIGLDKCAAPCYNMQALKERTHIAE